MKIQTVLLATILLVITITGTKLVATARSQNYLNQPTSYLPENYTSEQIEYFLEVAMGSEYAGSQERVRKWQGEVRIKVAGTPTREDMKTLTKVIDEINQLTPSIYLILDNNQPNLEMYFVPESRFGEYEPNYVPVNYGFFWTWWNKYNTIYQAKILVSTEGITQKERSHLIREELTQSLGLMKDSNRDETSIFYQGWTDSTEYNELDKTVISMLYRPEIYPGMTRSQVRDILKHVRVDR